MPLVSAGLKLLDALIHGRGKCAACKDFTAIGDNGESGYFKMKHGESPAIHAEPGFSQLWIDDVGVLHILNGDTGTDRTVVMEEDEN